MDKLEYTVVRSKRKTVSIRITEKGAVEVRAPLYLADDRIHRFVVSKENWIRKHLQNRKAPDCPPFTEAELRALAHKALEVIPGRVAYFAPRVGVTYGRITIRNQKTRWGSCSTKGNLNFNCLLMLAPPEVLDYVVIHELCHRKEMNHSAGFWAAVERIYPEYKAARTWLKQNGAGLIARLGR
ncbi:MAG: M48 family metallopeptidase [Oscillospiraceae bacterium]|nr:M48 family metallopeptidase [Oscillospiraceae bacterium]